MEQASQKENISRKFSSIIKGWFLTEPLYFSIAVKHSIVENPLLNIPLRTGQLRLEYNSSLLASATDLQLESLLKCEMSRVLLGHPYQRQPLDCKKKLLYLASDIILSRMLPSDIVEVCMT